MPKPDAPFFDYFPAARPHQQWGIWATSFGRVSVRAEEAYPSMLHPRDHFLSWNKGRVLQEFQVLFISQGRGEFESAHSVLAPVESGTILVLFPGVWHRYRPTPGEGWTEHWLELQGPAIERLRQNKILDPRQPMYRVGTAPEIVAAMSSAEYLAKTKPPGFQVRLGFTGLQILTELIWSLAATDPSERRLERVVQESLKMLSSHFDRPISPEQIASDLHIGYSYFRRVFKARTGSSPKAYRLELRFRRTCDFLRNTDFTLKEIARQLGYDSPYHLSIDFKKRTGLPPTRWRLRTIRRGKGA